MPVAVGFSNGANIAASLLLMRPGTLAGALLMRVMLPFEPQPLHDLSATPVLLLSGAAVSHEVVPAGHNLTQRDLALAAQWLGAFGLEHLQ